MGEINYAAANPLIIREKWDMKRQRGILCIGHKHTATAQAGFALMEKTAGSEAIVRTLGVSGILAKASKKYIID